MRKKLIFIFILISFGYCRPNTPLPYSEETYKAGQIAGIVAGTFFLLLSPIGVLASLASLDKIKNLNKKIYDLKTAIEAEEDEELFVGREDKIAREIESIKRDIGGLKAGVVGGVIASIAFLGIAALMYYVTYSLRIPKHVRAQLFDLYKNTKEYLYEEGLLALKIKEGLGRNDWIDRNGLNVDEKGLMIIEDAIDNAVRRNDYKLRVLKNVNYLISKKDEVGRLCREELKLAVKALGDASLSETLMFSCTSSKFSESGLWLHNVTTYKKDKTAVRHRPFLWGPLAEKLFRIIK